MNSSFTRIVRILLGIILIVFGANKIYSFIPLPQPPAEASSFMESLINTGYMLTVVAIIEICIGFMLILKLYVPFALMVLVPISLNILLFHLFLDVPGIGAAIVVVALNAILLYKHRRRYVPLFREAY
ncbi:DoxX family membrane protein [Flavobacterium psychrotrophum]|uniref:DoxX family membrane protein n=1 Tax=Flavobacterium psychrotrophum TaxID=2294119 RepID=UPI000E318C84|nr:DoxX family membrane protein [Flavobacterium psychrotrophum]